MTCYKKDFSVFNEYPNLVYLDHAATSQKPEIVVDAVANAMRFNNGSPHRGAHFLSVSATQAYDKGRTIVKNFINASSEEEIVFTRNATESLNLIAYSYGMNFLSEKDIILVSITSHHSNLVPWQQVAEKTGATLEFLLCDEAGNIPEKEYDKFRKGVKIVAFPWVSNGIGVIHPVKKLVQCAHEVGAIAVVDAAQSVGHLKVDVADIDADFLAFSGHKMFAPQGIGVLFGKMSLFDKMPPFMSGGDMIEYVEMRQTTFAQMPQKFEAGTQNVSGVIGLSKAIEYIEAIGINEINMYETQLIKELYASLEVLPFITIYGPNKQDKRGALITFNVDGIHPHDVASLLDSRGIAIRAGHHCTQPLMKHLNLYSTCRASLSVYNDKSDIEKLIEGLKYVREVFGYVN